MVNFYDDNADLKFYIDKAIDWASLVGVTEFDYKAPDGFPNEMEALDFYREVLGLLGEFSANEVAPYTKDIDCQHPTLKNGEVSFPPVTQEIMDKLNALQVHSMCLPRELGGMNCPYILHLVMTELFARSDVSMAAHVGFHGGMALAALVFSTYEGSTEFDAEAARIKSTRFREMIEEIGAGKAWASMDITESGAGSDMAALTAQAVLEDDGRWYLTGNKIFITSGHAKYHYVVAKTEKCEENNEFSGLKALSMFLVKAYDVDAQGNRTHHAWFDNLEDKLGHHGSATVGVRYDHTPAQLIGKRGDGFRLMLLIMNNARLGIGFEALGICEAAYRMAKAYASERSSMGKTIDRHEMIADYLEQMQTDIQALRALSMEGAFHEEMSHKKELLLRYLPPAKPEDRKAIKREVTLHQKISRRMTPLVKYMGSEKAVEMSRQCIQIHGGYGYSTEYGAEKLLRDAMVLPIYEGTSQIQSLMVMKDSLMGILKAPGDFFSGLAKSCWRSCFTADSAVRRTARLQRRQHMVLLYLLRRLAIKKLAGGLGKFTGEWDPKRDFALAMLHAERLTRLSIDVAVCEALLAQALRFPERRELLERYLERAEQRCRYLHDEITKTGDRLLAVMEKQQTSAQI
jgi:alkylation response protein AidB-like acyl-CoA dehydrogenase